MWCPFLVYMHPYSTVEQVSISFSVFISVSLQYRSVKKWIHEWHASVVIHETSSHFKHHFKVICSGLYGVIVIIFPAILQLFIYYRLRFSLNSTWYLLYLGEKWGFISRVFIVGILTSCLRYCNRELIFLNRPVTTDDGRTLQSGYYTSRFLDRFNFNTPYKSSSSNIYT